MEIIYKLGDFPDPGDRYIYKGIQEINKNNYQNALKYFEKGSIYENEYASLFVAIFYFTGFGLTEREPAKAFHLFKDIALNWNNPVAQYFLGSMYFEGDHGVPADTEWGVRWLSLAGDNGWTDALANLGVRYCCSESIEIDHQKSVTYLERVAKSTDGGTVSLDDTVLYLFGNPNFKIKFTHVQQDIIWDLSQSLTESVSLLPKNEDTSNDDEVKKASFWRVLVNAKLTSLHTSQLYIAIIYISGDNNIPKDLEKAMHWAKKAAENGNEIGFMMVAQFYENGIGTEKDYRRAMSWYKRAFIRGNNVSLYHIGALYYHGKGVKKDGKLALKYFRKMVSNSDDEGIFHGWSYFLMGEIFHYGDCGVSQNYQIAYECYYRSFEYGIPRGATKIGLMYGLGEGVEQDEEKEYEWFKKGAILGCPLAQCGLGTIHFKGHKGRVDLEEAMYWYKLSDIGGFESAKVMIEEIDKIINNHQLL